MVCEEVVATVSVPVPLCFIVYLFVLDAAVGKVSVKVPDVTL